MESLDKTLRSESEISQKALEGRTKALRLAAKITEILNDPSKKWSSIASDPNYAFSQKVYVPVTDHPEVNFIGLLVGPGGSEQKRMEIESNASISLRGKGSGGGGRDIDVHEPMYVLVSGEKEEFVTKGVELVTKICFDANEREIVKKRQLNLIAARKSGDTSLLLNESLYQTEDGEKRQGSADARSEIIKIPRDRVGHIVGKGGENIRRVQTVSNAFVQVSQEESDDPRMKDVYLEGTPEELAKAKEEIHRLLDEYGEKRREQLGISLGHEVEVMQIPKDTVGLLIGAGGSTIRDLQARTNAIVVVAKENESDPSLPTRSVTVAGPRANIELAKSQIEALILTLSHSHAMDGNDIASIEIFVPNDNVGMLIGRGGETIKSMMMRTGAKVEVSQTETGPKRLVSVSGLPQNVEAALSEIEALVGIERKAMPNIDPYDAANYYAQGGTGTAEQKSTPSSIPGLTEEQIAQYAAYYGMETEAYKQYLQAYYRDTYNQQMQEKPPGAE